MHLTDTEEKLVQTARGRLDSERQKWFDTNAEFRDQYLTIIRQGIVEERARVREVMHSPEASGRRESALHLLFDTDLSASEIISLLATLPSDQRKAPSLAQRMQAERTPQLRVDGPSDQDKSQRIVTSFKVFKGQRDHASEASQDGETCDLFPDGGGIE